MRYGRNVFLPERSGTALRCIGRPCPVAGKEDVKRRARWSQLIADVLLSLFLLILQATCSLLVDKAKTRLISAMLSTGLAARTLSNRRTTSIARS